MHELSHPSDSYNYILGLYRVIDNLTTSYPDVLWEGCASGGGRYVKKNLKCMCFSAKE